MIGRLLAVLGACACLGAAPAGLAYRIAPVLAEGKLTALKVELRFQGDLDGVTELDLPHNSGDEGRGAWARDLRDVSVDGAQVREDGAWRRVLTHAPGAPIVVRYRIVSGYDGVPSREPFRPIVQPDWFAVHGERAFVRPQGHDRDAVRVSWQGLPPGWIGRSNLEGRAATVAEVDDGYLLGGAGWREAVRPLGPARVRMLFRPQGWQVSPERSLDTLAGVVGAGFAYWGDRPRDFLIPVIQLSRGDFGGRGLADGFLIYGDAEMDLTGYRQVFAHEHEHSWISRQIGGFPEVNDNLEAWLNEGFTEATAARVLVKGGLWRAADFAADLNASLLRYGVSPEKTAPNQRIQDARGSNFDVSKLPYDRGRLLALVWERRLRAATGGRAGLQAVLQTQRRMAQADAATGRKRSADVLFPLAVRQVADLDISDDLARLVDRGEAIDLPADLFGDCGTIGWVSQPVFDRGFDLDATVKNGRHVVGLEPGGPAARAGLREGDRIRISEVFSRDSQTPLTYRVVEADGAERAVTYKPEGAGTVRFQKLELGPAAETSRCRAVFAGGA